MRSWTGPWQPQFEGGTIYQAFLSALSYHRWHAPVSGTVVKTYLVEGTYYSEALNDGNDPSVPNDSQGYIAEVTTRALIFIEADNPDIGLMCFMAVGMAEVSTCDIGVMKDSTSPRDRKPACSTSEDQPTVCFSGRWSILNSICMDRLPEWTAQTSRSMPASQRSEKPDPESKYKKTGLFKSGFFIDCSCYFFVTFFPIIFMPPPRLFTSKPFCSRTRAAK